MTTQRDFEVSVDRQNESVPKQQESRPELRICGDTTQMSIVFDPISVPERRREASGSLERLDTIWATVTFNSEGGRTWTREETENGFEPLAFAHLRDDMRQLLANRGGSLGFGSHDRGDLIRMTHLVDETVGIECNPWPTRPDLFPPELPEEEMRHAYLGTVQFSDLERAIQQIDSMAQTLGPLDGFCGACGRPNSRYDDR